MDKPKKTNAEQWEEVFNLMSEGFLKTLGGMIAILGTLGAIGFFHKMFHG